MNHNDYKIVIESIWELAKEGLSALTIDRISQQSSISEAEVQELFPHQQNILLAMIEDLTSHVELPELDRRLTPRDQIFDAVMLYFDRAHPRRLAIKNLLGEVVWRPLLLKHITPRLYSIGESIVDKYQSATGVLQFGQKLAFNGAMAHALSVFADDDTFDLSRTMATLDQDLKTVENLTINCQSFFR
jgi:AcrR family transcriptional regulator